MDYPQAIVASAIGVTAILGSLTALLRWKKGNSVSKDTRNREANKIITNRLAEFRDGPCAERSGGIERQIELTRESLSTKIDDAQEHTRIMIDTQRKFMDQKFDALLEEVRKRNDD